MNIEERFIRLALECKVLQFGEFTLKSGRISPYFFNTGLFCNGAALREVGQIYAQKILNTQIEFQHLFGPAYKGLPLATATAIALAESGKNPTVTFNRKEAKTHGEAGELIGATLQGKTIFIDDVITAGTAFRQAQQQITNAGGDLCALVIALDRCEKGLSNQSTLSEIEAQGIKVISIITLIDLINYLQRYDNQYVNGILAYQQKYGAHDI